MAMLLLRKEMELLATVDAVRVTNQPELLEDVERPVDRRGRGARIDVTRPLDQLAPGQVSLRTGQDFDQRASLVRPAQPAGAQAIAQGVDGDPRAMLRHRTRAYLDTSGLLQLVASSRGGDRKSVV